jgi:RNA polymerase primary sigma factor
MTLEEIGRRFGLTRERIRQLKERALGRLRRQEHAPALMEHYQDS